MTAKKKKTIIALAVVSALLTAAVYRGFGSLLSQFPLTFRHRAGVSPYTSSFDLAQTCVFGKQSLGPILCGLFPGSPYPEVTGSFCRVP